MRWKRVKAEFRRLTPEEAEAEADSDIDIDIDRLALWLEEEAEEEDEAEADLDISALKCKGQAQARASRGSSSSHVLREYHRDVTLNRLAARVKLSLESSSLARTLRARATALTL